MQDLKKKNIFSHKHWFFFIKLKSIKIPIVRAEIFQAASALLFVRKVINRLPGPVLFDSHMFFIRIFISLSLCIHFYLQTPSADSDAFMTSVVKRCENNK